jgi:hypothetical protein
VSKKSYHVPQGNPCEKCGKPALRHRVDHAFNLGVDNSDKNDTPTCECGLPEHCHRARKRVWNRTDNRNRVWNRTDTRKNRERERDEPPMQYIGIDGEGQGREDHRYVLLAASNEDGSKTWIAKPGPGKDRLSTEQCLDLILELPRKRTKVFSFSFNYDLTKMLEDLDNKSLYELFRPELRPSPKDETGKPKGSHGPTPVKWRGYSLNLQGTKFTVRKRGRKVIIWDLFKFFQSKFVSALKDWKVGNPELWERMSMMKDKRSEFDKEKEENVLAYCLEETRCIAELARRLIEAHEGAGLKLRSFYGAGSSGAAMLTALGIKEHVRQPHADMKRAVASAFFGGRFENSVIGQIEGLVYNRDISSAYPYHTTFLPCLEHGRWSRTYKRSDLEGKRAALVGYSLGNSSISTWGPFPFRTNEGSISFPIQSGGGWVWLEEYLAGERIFPHVEFREAWVYQTECDCRPFSKVPEYYVLRLQIGKEGPGLVIKLGVNSIYGKLAQSVGNAIFNCWIWAGMVTSGCRAQVLDMLGLHKDWSNLLAIATDGIFTREKIQAPLPLETDTGLIINGASKPLGGWEEKTYSRGMFFARPGIYFPLDPTKEDIKDIRGRGVGKGVVLENWNRIVDAWNQGGLDAIARIANVTRFCGAKTSISSSSKGYHRAYSSNGRKPSYGQWITRKVEMSFHPMPKREEMNKDGTLKLRKFPKDLRSVPYSHAMISREALEMIKATVEIMEQPDADLTDYELET